MVSLLSMVLLLQFCVLSCFDMFLWVIQAAKRGILPGSSGMQAACQAPRLQQHSSCWLCHRLVRQANSYTGQQVLDLPQI